MISIFFKTYGCQANVADSEGLIKYLETLGCQLVDRPDLADMIVVNTCAIREKAELKMFSYLGDLASYKREKPYIKIGVIGCVATYRKKEIYQRFDHVNFVFGAREDLGAFQSYLFDVVTKIETTKQLFLQDPEQEIEFGGQDRDVMGIIKAQQEQGTNTQAVVPKADASVTTAQLGALKERKQRFQQSFVNITTGCNNYCTYCIVPFTRGQEKSYSLETICQRVKKDVEAGAKEVTLVGQNVNSYQCPQTGKKFAALLEAVAHIPGEFWVRYVSPHPKDMTNDVLQAMADYKEKLCGWIHFPLQAGSDSVLEAMNRTYTVDEYMQQVNWIRQITPHATISSDIIVGFPGETEDDYQGTRRVMELVKFDFVFSFIYSKRKYTKAFKMEDDCPADVKARRLEELQLRQKDICYERNMEKVGKRKRVLVEKRLKNGKLLARTAGNIRVMFDGDDHLINQFVFVTITQAGRVNLSGELSQAKTENKQVMV